MAKLTLQNMTSGYLTQDIYNANNAAIILAMSNTLSRDGTSPNEMGVSLDMNSFNINNCGNINVTSLTIDGVPILPPLVSGVTTLSGLTDVTDATPTVGNILIGTGTDWESAPLVVVASDIAVSDDDVVIDANATRLNFLGDVVTVTQQSPGVADITIQTPDPLIYGGLIGGIQAWPGASVPNADWVECNGQSLDTTTYAFLFAVIGYTYGGSGASFNVPDLRGEFIRGWDNSAGNDPDAASRTDRGDGTTGDNIGTKQADMLKSHVHTDTGVEQGDADGSPNGHTFSGTHNTGATGGNETRGRNVAMMYVMRAFLSAGFGAGGGGGVSVVTEADSVELTDATMKLNFLGFEVSEPVDDEIDIQFGVAQVAGIYAPGYNYSRVDDDEFTVDLADAENLFYVGRRVRFSQGGTNYHGEITAVDFDVTSANDTHVTLTMESTDVVPTGTFEVSLVSSASSWSPISSDPFSGACIEDSCFGTVNGTDYIFAVGAGGRFGYSSDGGLNWTMLTTGTSEKLNACTIDSSNAVVWAGGNAGVLVSWDGSSVTLDTSSVPALSGTESDNIVGLSYSSSEDALVLLFHHTGAQYSSASSTDQGSTWTVRDTTAVDPAALRRALLHEHTTAGVTGPVMYVLRASVAQSLDAASHDDTSFSSADSLGTVGTCMGFFHETTPARVYAVGTGAIVGILNWTGDDTTTFSNVVHSFAYSATHDRLVCVGANQQIGYWDGADKTTNDAWVSVQNGFDPTAAIQSVVWDSANGNFCAFADNGQICRSTNGIN